MIDTIIFDIGNVLLDFPWDDFLVQLRLDKETTAKIRKEIIASPLWKDLDTNKRPREEIMKDFEAALPEEKGVSRYYIDNVHKCITLNDFAIPLLKELREKGYKLYYLSNWSEDWIEGPARRGCFEFLKYMDGGLFSHEEHIAKPDINFYKKLLDKYNISPHKALFVDDTEENLRAARALSIETHLFRGCEGLMEKIKEIERFPCRSIEHEKPFAMFCTCSCDDGFIFRELDGDVFVSCVSSDFYHLQENNFIKSKNKQKKKKYLKEIITTKEELLSLKEYLESVQGEGSLDAKNPATLSPEIDIDDDFLSFYLYLIKKDGLKIKTKYMHRLFDICLNKKERQKLIKKIDECIEKYKKALEKNEP